MRIAVIGPSYPFRGGIAHYTTCLFRAFATRKETRYFAFSRQYPSILFPGQSDREPDDSPFREDRAERMLDGVNPFSWLRTALRIRFWHPDVMILPWWVPYWTPHFLTLLTLRPRGCRALVVCHNATPHEDAPLHRIAIRSVLSRVDGIVVHGQEEAAHIRASVPEVPCAVCFHPVYPPSPPTSPPKVTRELLGIGSGPLLLFFGFVRPYKGLVRLLRVWESVIEIHPSARLVVAGEFWGDTRTEVDTILGNMRDSRSVHLLDRYISEGELANLLHACDLSVFPYESVTGSGALQTALGRGVPVVATGTGSFSEMIRGEGILVEPRSDAALRDGILDALVPDTLARLRSTAALAPTRFTWDSMVKTLLDLGGGGQ